MICIARKLHYTNHQCVQQEHEAFLYRIDTHDVGASHTTAPLEITTALPWRANLLQLDVFGYSSPPRLRIADLYMTCHEVIVISRGVAASVSNCDYINKYRV